MDDEADAKGNDVDDFPEIAPPSVEPPAEVTLPDMTKGDIHDRMHAIMVRIKRLESLLK